MSDIPEPVSDSPERTTNLVESTNWDIGNAALPTAVTTNRFDIVSNGTLSVEPVLPMETSHGGKVLGASPPPIESSGITPKGGSAPERSAAAITPPVERMLDTSAQPRSETRALGPSFETGQSSSAAPRGESLARTTPTIENSFGNNVPVNGASSDLVASRSDLKLNTLDSNNSVHNAALELVTQRITLTKAASDSLPAFELVVNQNKIEKQIEPVKSDSIQKPLPKTVSDVVLDNLKIQETSAKFLTKMNQTVESVLSNHESRTNDVQTALHLASNVRIDETSGRVRLSPIENNVSSLRFQNLVRSASETFTFKKVLSEDLTKASDSQRLVQLPGNLKNLEIARQMNLNGTLQASFNIKPAIDTLINPSVSDRRSPALIGLVKDVLTNPAYANLTVSVRSDALSAQAILRSQFSTVRGDSLTPLSFTIKDARTSMNVGDQRLPGYLEIGRKKKKKKNGEEEDECATNLSPESCRYISGLELGLLIALAGIAKREGPDRTNRRVVKENLSENSSSSLEKNLSQTCEFISNAIKQNKIEKGLSSKQHDNQFKSPNKIKIKDLLRKLKEEMRTLSATDFEKLQSSDTKEELLDRLSKIVANDEKRLFAKRQLSAFGTPKQGYRPLWLVTVNDTLTKLAEQIYLDPDVAWLIADMNITRVKERYVNGKRVIELQSRQQIELPIQEDIDLFNKNKPKEATADKLITIVQANQLDKELINSQLHALQIRRKAIGTT